MLYLKNAQQIEKIRKSGRLTARALELAGQSLKPGLTTKRLDKLISDFIVSNGGAPASLNYTELEDVPPFPGGCCVSVNEEVVHGVPGPRKILDVDLVTVDVTVVLDGFFGDAARTFLVGKASEKARSLTEAAEEALRLGMAEARDGARLGDIGQAIQDYVKSRGYSVVRAFTGHGVGLEMHEEPEILHYGQRGRGIRLKSGMVIAIEPMINEGGFAVKILDDGWTVVTSDGKLSAQFEHTLAVTADGPDILTLP